MNTVIVFPAHDSCLSSNKDDTAVFWLPLLRYQCYGIAHTYSLGHTTGDTMGLVLMCVHLTLCSSSKYTNLVLRTDLHRVLKVQKARAES